MNVDPPPGNRRRIWKATILVTCAVLVAVAGIAIGLTSGGSGTPEDEKQAIIDRLAATRSAEAQYIAEHPESPPTGNPPTLKPTIVPSSWSVGIVDEAGAPIAGMAFGMQNHWSWDLGGNHVVIYAGREGSEAPNPGRGALIALVSAMDLSAVPDLSGSYLAPSGVGSLHIVSYQGTLLTLLAATGETFYFDAETRAFTDANGNPVATDTPSPTQTPEPSPEPTPTVPATAQPTVVETAATGLGG